GTMLKLFSSKDWLTQPDEGTREVEEQGRAVIPASPDFPELLARCQERERVALAVMDGHLSILEAAREVHRIQGEQNTRFLAFVPGNPAEERFRRQVINCTEGIETGRGLDRAVSRRLWAEFADGVDAEATDPPKGADWPQWRGPNRDGV